MKKNIKEKWQQLRNAKNEKKQAESAIISAGIVPDGKSCLTKTVAITEMVSTLRLLVCESFHENKICDNVNCSLHRKNMHYILACENYEKERKEFWQMLLHCGRTK